MFICELLQGGGHGQIRSDPIYEKADVAVVGFGGRQWVDEEIGEGDVA
jgi:hypothetical protein